MFVGGPNTREDFHIEMGAEFFYQLRGNMELPTIQKGARKVVRIGQGQVFLLPARVPHSPQRPEKNSLGLVIERRRNKHEMDALRFYTDPAKCDQPLWERYFYCADLGKDLKPVIAEWLESAELKSRTVTETSLPDTKLIQERDDVEVPDPINLEEWVEAHAGELAEDGASLPLFPGHPDSETQIFIQGAAASEEAWREEAELETFFFQIKGVSTVRVSGSAPGQEDSDAADETQPNSSSEEPEAKKRLAVTEHELGEQSCFVVAPGQRFVATREAGAVCMVVTQGKRSEAATPPAD